MEPNNLNISGKPDMFPCTTNGPDEATVAAFREPYKEPFKTLFNAEGGIALGDIAKERNNFQHYLENAVNVPVVDAVCIDRELRIIKQAAKVRNLQKQWYKGSKEGNKDYDVLQQSKAAEKELDVLLEEYHSPQGRML